MNSEAKGSLDVLLPRGLLGSGLDVLDAPITSEGLIAVRLEWDKARINQIKPISPSSNSDLKLLLPRLVEPHAHIDKAFTWQKFPNFTGTYEEALRVNLKEHKSRTEEDVTERAEKALRLSLKNGLRAIRSHIDSFGMNAYQIWETLADIKNNWEEFIRLEFVALVPLEYWGTGEGQLLAIKIASQGGLLGGVIVPPFDKKQTRASIRQMLILANKLGCAVDIHIDEAQNYPAAGLRELINVLDEMKLDVPITCSHSSSMSLLNKRDLIAISERLASHKVHVVALPLTNSWLLGRYPHKTLLKRPLAPIYQLQRAGITVSVGGDNVQDAWYPSGNFDPLALMAFAMPFAHLAPWERLGLTPFTTAPANMMGLEWDGIIELGSPADFILLNVTSWIEALSSPPSRDIIINGQWLRKNHLPK